MHQANMATPNIQNINMKTSDSDISLTRLLPCLTDCLLFQELVSDLQPEPAVRSSAPADQVRAGLPSQGPRGGHDRHRAGRRRDLLLHRRPRPPRGGPLPGGQRVQLRELLRGQRGARGSARERPLPPAAPDDAGGAPQPVGEKNEVIGGLDHMMGGGPQPEGVGALVKLPYSVINIIIILFLYRVGVLYVQW